MDRINKIIITICVLATLAVVSMSFAGCALITPQNIERLDAAYEVWWNEYTNKLAQVSGGTVQTPPQDADADGGTVETPPQDPGDAVPYGALQWRYGGFNGAKAAHNPAVDPRLANLRSDGRKVSYKFDRGLDAWGISHNDPKAICAVFFLRDGAWVGGKFDWVSTSRTSRELKHVESYNNWPGSGIKLPWRGRVAFVVISADGRRRSNVLEAQSK